jgi:hypothetical protein
LVNTQAFGFAEKYTKHDNAFFGSFMRYRVVDNKNVLLTDYTNDYVCLANHKTDWPAHKHINNSNILDQVPNCAT